MVSVEPWAKRTSGEQRWNRLFEAVPEPEALSETARLRVKLRLRKPASRTSRLSWLRLVAVGAVIGVVGAASAQWTALRLLGPRHEMRLDRGFTAASAATPPVAARPARSTAPASPPVAPVPAAASAAFPPLPAPPTAPVQNSRLGLEASSLEAAVSALRGGATARALEALDQHRRDFPGGALELEARVARVEALLKLGQRQEARRELATLPLESVGRKLELRLIRAELRADGDCGGALEDFQVLLGQTLPQAWSERALFGRGACLLKLGDRAGASRDFSRYLEQFPDGRFADQIRGQGTSVSSPGR